MSGAQVAWGDYEATSPVADRPLHEIARREAKAAFGQLMEIKDHRKSELNRLLSRNGVDLADADATAWLRRVGNWIAANVEPDAAGIANIWFVVAQDVGLTAGDLLIREAMGVLEWRLFTVGATDVAYQRPVVMGFQRTPNSKYNYDPILGIATFAIAASQDRTETPDKLVASFEFARGLA